MSPNPITAARDCMPLRPLSRTESLRIAELQAQRVLDAAGVTAPSLPERAITEIPKLLVRRVSPFPASGATQWSAGSWMVILNGSEPLARQRFSLCHELKHIIDHRYAGLIYSRLPSQGRPASIEQICDYFAACLLMPRTWVKNAWASGDQDIAGLAQRFGVSAAAMKVRLQQVGLLAPTARCLSPAGELPAFSTWREAGATDEARGAGSR